MASKRKLRDGKSYPAKHNYSLRSKSKFDQFELENFSKRFPHLFEDILGELDYKCLTKFREVSKFWSVGIREQRIYWKRKIEQCTEQFTQFNKEWKIVVRKIPLQTLKTMEVATCSLTGSLTGSYDVQLSPLHIAAKSNLKLFREIAPKFEDKNPPNSFGDTPLLSAVKSGHLDICKYIIDNVEENKKNPAKKIGFTPLHYAAILNDLEIYKLIVENTEDKHPQDQMGVTPLHIAVENDHLEICNFVSEKNVKKEDMEMWALIKIINNSLRTLKEAIESKQYLVKLLEKILEL